MKRKYAFLLMGEEYTPAQHNALFETDDIDSHIITVRTPDEARETVKRLHKEGFGAIEVCGAFGPELTRELVDMTNNEIAFGYSVHLDEKQDAVAAAFWGGH